MKLFIITRSDMYDDYDRREIIGIYTEDKVQDAKDIVIKNDVYAQNRTGRELKDYISGYYDVIEFELNQMPYDAIAESEKMVEDYIDNFTLSN